MNMSINSVNPVFTSHKNSNKGAKIGAITGSVVASAWAYGALKNFDKIVKYMPNTIDMKVYKQTKVLSAAIFIALATGIGALVGKGAQKLSEYIKSKKKENKHNNIVKTDNGEFKVKNGHPKSIYKKNPKTGKWEQICQVYDGSWGKEVPNEDLVRFAINNSKNQ